MQNRLLPFEVGTVPGPLALSLEKKPDVLADRFEKLVLISDKILKEAWACFLAMDYVGYGKLLYDWEAAVTEIAHDRPLVVQATLLTATKQAYRAGLLFNQMWEKLGLTRNATDEKYFEASEQCRKWMAYLDTVWVLKRALEIQGARHNGNDPL